MLNITSARQNKKECILRINDINSSERGARVDYFLQKALGMNNFDGKKTDVK